MNGEGDASLPDGIVFDGRRFKVRLRTLPEPIGAVRRLEIVEAPSAAAVVPILDRDGAGEPMVVLVEQERPVVGARTLEIPAGLLTAQESAEHAARRELEEETGYRAGSLQPLTRIYSSPGISTEEIHIYLARDLSPARPDPGPADTTEIARVRTLPLSEAVALAARGDIRDAKTITGLLLAAATMGAAAGRSQAPQTGGGGSMPVDPLNMPFVTTETRSTAPDGANASPATLTLEAVLTQEFNYANVTAYQAQEDRARVFNLYLLLVGVLASALTAVYQLGDRAKQFTQPLAFLLLALAGLLGVVFFLKLIRLRQAFRDSLIAMNRIKEYYIRRFISQVPDIADAFHWRLRTIPKGEKVGTLTFLVCFTVALLGSLCFAGAFAVGAGYARSQGWLSFTEVSDPAIYAGALAALILSLWLHTRYYRRRLSAKLGAEQLQHEEQTIGPSAMH
jgi:ADP-ribose pyrophosphatase